MCIGTSNPELWTRVVHTIWWRCITCTYLHCRACTIHPPSCLPSFYILTIGIVLKEKPLGRGQLDSETTNFAHWTLSLLSLLPFPQRELHSTSEIRNWVNHRKRYLQCMYLPQLSCAVWTVCWFETEIAGSSTCTCTSLYLCLYLPQLCCLNSVLHLYLIVLVLVLAPAQLNSVLVWDRDRRQQHDPTNIYLPPFPSVLRPTVLLCWCWCWCAL